MTGPHQYNPNVTYGDRFLEDLNKDGGAQKSWSRLQQLESQSTVPASPASPGCRCRRKRVAVEAKGLVLFGKGHPPFIWLSCLLVTRILELLSFPVFLRLVQKVFEWINWHKYGKSYFLQVFSSKAATAEANLTLWRSTAKYPLHFNL